MKRIENHCVGCTDLGMHCLGSACSNRKVEVYYCDKCGDELDAVYEVDGEELCEFCLKDKFSRN